MSFTNYLAKELLNHIFNDPAYAANATVFVGLSSTTPGEDESNITEPGDTYVRQSTAAADWTAATDADPSSKDNANPIAFPTAVATWAAGADMTHFVLFEDATLGEAIAWGALNPPKPVLIGDTASFAIGALILTLD